MVFVAWVSRLDGLFTARADHILCFVRIRSILESEFRLVFLLAFPRSLQTLLYDLGGKVVAELSQVFELFPDGFHGHHRVWRLVEPCWNIPKLLQTRREVGQGLDLRLKFRDFW